MADPNKDEKTGETTASTPTKTTSKRSTSRKTTAAPKAGETAGGADTKQPDASGEANTQVSGTQTDATADAKKDDTPEVEAVDIFEKVNTTDMSDAGKAFYAASDLIPELPEGAVVIYTGNVPLIAYSPDNLTENFFKDLPNGVRVGIRLNDFITKSLSGEEDQLKAAHDMFLLIVSESERMEPANFQVFYERLTAFIGQDLKAGGFFSTDEVMSAVRRNAGLSAFIGALKRLVPGPKRKTEAAKMNYAQPCSLFKQEKTRQLFSTTFQ